MRMREVTQATGGRSAGRELKERMVGAGGDYPSETGLSVIQNARVTQEVTRGVSRMPLQPFADSKCDMPGCGARWPKMPF